MTEIETKDKILYSKFFVFLAFVKQETLFWIDKKHKKELRIRKGYSDLFASKTIWCRYIIIN